MNLVSGYIEFGLCGSNGLLLILTRMHHDESVAAGCAVVRGDGETVNVGADVRRKNAVSRGNVVLFCHESIKVRRSELLAVAAAGVELNSGNVKAQNVRNNSHHAHIVAAGMLLHTARSVHNRNRNLWDIFADFGILNSGDGSKQACDGGANSDVYGKNIVAGKVDGLTKAKNGTFVIADGSPFAIADFVTKTKRKSVARENVVVFAISRQLHVDNDGFNDGCRDIGDGSGIRGQRNAGNVARGDGLSVRARTRKRKSHLKKTLKVKKLLRLWRKHLFNFAPEKENNGTSSKQPDHFAFFRTSAANCTPRTLRGSISNGLEVYAATSTAA